MGNSLAQDLEAELWQLPKIDVHCHMRPGQLTTAEPQELIFYHFLWREYLGAGAKKEDLCVQDSSQQQNRRNSSSTTSFGGNT